MGSLSSDDGGSFCNNSFSDCARACLHGVVDMIEDANFIPQRIARLQKKAVQKVASMGARGGNEKSISSYVINTTCKHFPDLSLVLDTEPAKPLLQRRQFVLAS